MSYFPAFLKFDDKKILIIGGGKIAYEKLEHLLNFTTNITIIAKEFNNDIEDAIDEHFLKSFKKPYEVNDLSGYDIVIAAIDDIPLQEEIYSQTRTMNNVLCNCVDVQHCCDFIFPSYIKKGDLTIAISTSGASPALAKQLRIYLSELIPDSMVEFLQEMREYRKTMPKGIERMRFLEQKAKDYINSWKTK